MSEGITPLKPSFAKTMHDHLPFPGRRTVGIVSDGEIARALFDLGDEAAHERGRADNAQRWAVHLAKLSDEAGKKAVAAFMANPESA